MCKMVGDERIGVICLIRKLPKGTNQYDADGETWESMLVFSIQHLMCSLALRG